MTPVPRQVKKIELMGPWRTTPGMALAVFKYMAARRISYGELCRRAVAALLTGDPFHDFDSNDGASAGMDASVWAESGFDNGYPGVTR